MPFAVDEEKISQKPGHQTLTALDPAKPPVKEIPHLEFPRVIYKHPKEPFRTIVHRNAQHEVVDQERVPSENLARVVKDAAELEAALKEGWVKEPYVPKAAPNPDEALYESRPIKAGKA